MGRKDNTDLIGLHGLGRISRIKPSRSWRHRALAVKEVESHFFAFFPLRSWREIFQDTKDSKQPQKTQKTSHSLREKKVRARLEAKP
jgi:hypothetical protein